MYIDCIIWSFKMRIKKGFTLAEILIVLTVIGVIATMTVPSMTKGIDEATYKAGYKKAFSVVTNIAGILKTEDNLPTASSTDGMTNFFSKMMDNLSVQEIVTQAQNSINSGVKYTGTTNYTNVTYGKVTSGDATGSSAGSFDPALGTFSPWIVTDDNIAYSLTAISGATCGTKGNINNQGSNTNARNATCLVVIVDTNGLNKLPNTIETQAANGFGAATTRTNTLRGDRYYIYIGRDGVAKGNKAFTLSGRLLADIK